MHFRKKKTLEKYHNYRREAIRNKTDHCDFCIDEPDGKENIFTLWKILRNIFPYDKIAERHDIIVPKRHFYSETEMNEDERKELCFIKNTILPKTKLYDVIWENFPHYRSVRHYHVHLIKIKPPK